MSNATYTLLKNEVVIAQNLTEEELDECKREEAHDYLTDELNEYYIEYNPERKGWEMFASVNGSKYGGEDVVEGFGGTAGFSKIEDEDDAKQDLLLQFFEDHMREYAYEIIEEDEDEDEDEEEYEAV